MVNRIDERERRRVLAEAVWRIVTRDGLAAASVRSVARESGLSTGSVRHFFGAQDELIAFAMEQLITVVGERIAAAGTIEDADERVVAVLSELIPLTDATRDEAFAHLQFVLRSRIDPRLAPIAEASFDAIHGVCREIVELQIDRGRLPADADVEARAVTLRALIDGLTYDLLLAPHLLSREGALAVLRAHLRGDADDRDVDRSRADERNGRHAGDRDTDDPHGGRAR